LEIDKLVKQQLQ